MKKSNLHETTVTVFRRYLEFAPEDTEDYIEYLISIDRLDEAAVKLAEIATQVDFVSKHGKSNQQLWNELGNLISKNPSKIKSLNVDAIIGEGLRRFIYQSGPLWNSLADYYVCSGLFERARDIYEEAMQTVTTVRDFAQVFDAYAQFEELGLSKCMERAAKNRIEDDDIELQLRLARFEHLMESHLLLLNAVSLRQNPPNVQEWRTRIRVYEDQPHERYKAMFEKIITLNIATPETVLNFSIFLIKNNQCDEAFRAYEKSIAHFKWPNVYDIWKTYLKLFLKQYRGTKLKETRDLFERCLEHCPPHLLFAVRKIRRNVHKCAMSIYKRAGNVVPEEDRSEMFNIYIKKATDIINARQIFEEAIEVLNDDNRRDMCLRFAEMETKLGEVDRARAIYAHCSQICDPRVTSNFWQIWREFEVRHGNEDTMREMLRIKRSVQAMYNTQVNMMSAQMLNNATNPPSEVPVDAMRLLDSKTQNTDNVAAYKDSIKFVRGVTEKDGNAESQVNNPDEMDIVIDDANDNDNEGEIEEDVPIEKQTIPSQVFGSLKSAEGEDDS